MDPTKTEQMLALLKTVKEGHESLTNRFDEQADQAAEQSKSFSELGEAVGRLAEVSAQTVESMKALGERMDAAEGKIKSRSVSLPGSDEDGDNEFMFSRAIRGMTTNDWTDAEFEKEVLDQTRQKALSQGVDTAGGFLVPEEHVTELIELLRARTVVEQLGATVMRGLNASPIDIPRQDGGATAAWASGENTDLSESDATFDNVTMTPKRLGVFTKLSNRLLRLSNPDAEAIVRRDLAATMARARDLAALRGTGASGQPTGIVNTSGINTVAVGTNGGPMTYALLVDMVSSLDEDDALFGRLGFAFHPKLRAMLSKIVDGNSRPLFQNLNAASLSESATILGYPWATTSQLPVNLTKGSGTNLTELFFANWEELIIGEWTGLLLAVTTQAEAAFKASQTWIKIEQEMDIAVRHPVSFCLVNDADSQ